jgi:hypothetical protein
VKTQIITLESHDDLISVRDRMSWAKTPRILLVWPRYEKVTLRFVDLKVLQRHALTLGAQLGLITRRANVRRDAEALGIPVFDSTTTAQKDRWPVRKSTRRHTPRPPRRDLRELRESVYPTESKWRTNPVVRVAVFSLAVMAVLAIASLFVPRAALTLYPETKTQILLIPVTASKSIESVSITGGVPLHTASLTVSDVQTLTVTGQIKIPQTKAQGIVRFSNLAGSEMDIPSGTIVYGLSESGERVNFSTLHETHLPSGAGKFVEVPVEAVQAGAAGNLPALAIKVVDGKLAVSMSVTNPEPTEGGTERSARGASAEDRDRVREQLLEKLESEALDRIRKSGSADDLILDQTIAVSKINNETYDPLEGQPGSSLRLTMDIEFNVQVISGKDLRQLAATTLAAGVPADSIPEPDSLKITPQSQMVIDDDKNVSFQLQAEQTLLRRIDQMQVFEYVGGRSTANAIKNLQAGLLLREKPQIQLSPSWWPWLPIIPFRISMVTQ